MSEALLEVIDPFEWRIVTITKDRFDIGRGESSDLRLADADVSRNHAYIINDGERFTLKDQGSLHGTFVNGSRISEHVLAQGDRMQFGRHRATDVVFLRLPSVQLRASWRLISESAS